MSISKQLLQKYPDVKRQVTNIHQLTFRELAIKSIIQEILLREILAQFLSPHGSQESLYDSITDSINEVYHQKIREGAKEDV